MTRCSPPQGARVGWPSSWLEAGASPTAGEEQGPLPCLAVAGEAQTLAASVSHVDSSDRGWLWDIQEAQKIS
jgi:hypothetical protein